MHAVLGNCTIAPMSDDVQVPATKADIQMLMEQMGKLYDASEQWKEEVITTLDERIDGKIGQSEERMKHYFDLTVETIRHDLLSANKDRIENHEDRLRRLERKIESIVA